MGLASHLWGTQNGMTWENMYLFKSISRISIPRSLINRLIGYQDKYFVRGLLVLNDTQSESIINNLENLAKTYLMKLQKKSKIRIIKF